MLLFDLITNTYWDLFSWYNYSKTVLNGLHQDKV